MFSKGKILLVSLVLFVFSCTTWLIGHSFAAPDEMDRGTSVAIIGFLGTMFFLFTTISLSFIMLISKLKNNKTYIR
ncbi:hypothetical protein [Rossellomorea aquimaris]|uniref:hypothetical protein n=1 Tax=Rossellomorea aquimaris TaxID=189382 RepID=UPI0007D0AE07|nr:hypothetical protein [Rossellomorea aquimaris]